MKAGLAAAALVGAATASPGYWPDPVTSSTPAAPVKPSTSAKADYWSIPAASSSSAKKSSSSTKKASTSSSWAAEASWPAKPVKPAASSADGAWAVPDYFDPQWACCKTVVTKTVWAASTSSAVPTTSSSTVWVTASPVIPAPYPSVWAVPSAGVYSEDAVTVTLTNTVTVVAKKTSALSSGDNWYGGVTTTVDGPTTVTCPYATKSTSGTWVWDDVATTTVTITASGVWTPVAPVSTHCSEATTIIWDDVTSYEPGTWTRPATTFTATTAGQIWNCPFEAPAKPTSTWSAPPAPVVPTTSAAPYWPAPAASSSAAPAKPSAPSGGNIAPNGNKWAITYTPYTTSGQCKSASDVDSDIAKIASWGFSTVRLYATDCSGLQNVGGSAKKYGLKIILGVFIDSTGLSKAWDQVEAISTWGSSGYWDIVAMIVVGNEAVFNGYCSASDLAGLITKSKGYWASAGYSGFVTTTEPVNIIQQWATTLCPVVDVAAANIQAFFTSSVSASWAGSFVQGQLALVEAACGKTAYNLESGWPSSGSSNGAAIPSTSDQKTAILDILAKAGSKTAIFSFEDDAWKDGGSFGVEKYFGCSDVFSGSSY